MAGTVIVSAKIFIRCSGLMAGTAIVCVIFCIINSRSGLVAGTAIVSVKSYLFFFLSAKTQLT